MVRCLDAARRILHIAGMNNGCAAIFDMDGVLVDTYQAHFQSWREMAASEGLEFTEAQFAPTFGCTSREILAALEGERRLSDAEIAAMDERKEAAFRRIIRVAFPAMPGATELLCALHASGLRLAVGSSGPPENVDFVLERLGVRGLLDAVVTGRDVTRGKPDPQVFLVAAERLSVPPARCVVIEDAPVGIAAARAAGMAAVGLASTGRTRAQLAAADLVVDSLSELSADQLCRLISRRQAPSANSGFAPEGDFP
jgi:beta-phosphoglucomutase